MEEFISFIGQYENLLFTVSLMVFAGLLCLQLFGLAGDVLGGEIGLDSASGDIDGGSGGAKLSLICLLMPFFASFGLLGLLSNWLIPTIADVGVGVKAIISVVVSGLLSWEFARKVAGYLGTLLPPVESYGLSHAKLSGCIGKVVSETMNVDKTARISVTDHRGTTYTLRGQLLEGHGEISHGEPIRVIEHDANSDMCFCAPLSSETKSDS